MIIHGSYGQAHRKDSSRTIMVCDESVVVGSELDTHTHSLSLSLSSRHELIVDGRYIYHVDLTTRPLPSSDFL